MQATSIDRTSVAELRARIPGSPTQQWPDGARYAIGLEHGSMTLEYYAPVGFDPQQPHERDELYIVHSGTSDFVLAGETVGLAAGDAIFVPAGAVHRFADFSSDFGAWVIFWGPEGGEARSDEETGDSGRSDRWAKVGAMKDALHLCMRFAFADLPVDARILCVGAGTGAELFYLAGAFPRFTFTAVEPAAEMLEACRARADEIGIGSRCVFHEGSLESLPQEEPYDAATAILVSHYLGDRGARERFFRSIGERLRPGGLLVNADLAANTDHPGFASLIDSWKTMLVFSGAPLAGAESQARRLVEKRIAIPAAEMEAIIRSSGFEEPSLFSQTLLIHAWLSRRPGVAAVDNSGRRI